MHVFKNALASNRKIIYTIMVIYNMCILSVCMKGVSNCFIFFIKGEGNLLPHFADHTYSTMESICISPIWELLYSRLHTVMNNLSIQQQLYAQISLKSLDSSLIYFIDDKYIPGKYITRNERFCQYSLHNLSNLSERRTGLDSYGLSQTVTPTGQKTLDMLHLHCKKIFSARLNKIKHPFPVPHLFINFKVSFYECIYLFVCNW